MSCGCAVVCYCVVVSVCDPPIPFAGLQLCKCTGNQSSDAWSVQSDTQANPSKGNAKKIIMIRKRKKKKGKQLGISENQGFPTVHM